MQGKEPDSRLFLRHVALLRNVQTVQELFPRVSKIPSKSRPQTLYWSLRSEVCGVSPYLPDILVSHSADLLDVGGGLGNVLEGVAPQLQLILLVLRRLDLNTWLHNDSSDNLLANEVSISSVSLLPSLVPHTLSQSRSQFLEPNSSLTYRYRCKRTGSQPQTDQSRCSCQH